MGKAFIRGKEKYSLAEKKELGKLVEKYKNEHDKEVKALQGKTHYDYKQIKHYWEIRNGKDSLYAYIVDMDPFMV